jgi:hypothetical protein
MQCSLSRVLIHGCSAILGDAEYQRLCALRVLVMPAYRADFEVQVKGLGGVLVL